MVLDPLSHLQSWLTGLRSNPAKPPGSFMLWREEKEMAEKRQIRKKSNWGGWVVEVNEMRGAILSSSCQKPRLWKDCFYFFPVLILLFLQEVPSGILSLINLCETKVGLELEKTNGSLSTLEPGPHRRPICRLLWGYFKDIYIYCFWCCKESHFLYNQHRTLLFSW